MGSRNLAALRGQLREAERRYAQANEPRSGSGGTPSTRSMLRISTRCWMERCGGRGARDCHLDAALRAVSCWLRSPGRDRSLWLAWGYARLGAAEKAREVLRVTEALLDERDGDGTTIMWPACAVRSRCVSNQPDSALAWFRRDDSSRTDCRRPNCPSCTAHPRGTRFDQASTADSARKYLTEFVRWFDGTDVRRRVLAREDAVPPG
jgi:hypothetical protein